jgi:hypothetical protein
MLNIILLNLLLQQPAGMLRILEATRQEWSGGREGSGTGVDYSIKLIPFKGSSKLQFVSITVVSNGCDFRITNVSVPERGAKFNKGDTVLILAQLKNVALPRNPKEKPYPVIGYTYKRKLYYLPVRQGIPTTKETRE